MSLSDQAVTQLNKLGLAAVKRVQAEEDATKRVHDGLLNDAQQRLTLLDAMDAWFKRHWCGIFRWQALRVQHTGWPSHEWLVYRRGVWRLADDVDVKYPSLFNNAETPIATSEIGLRALNKMRVEGIVEAWVRLAREKGWSLPPELFEEQPDGDFPLYRGDKTLSDDTSLR